MSTTTEIKLDEEFASTMQQLVAEAEQKPIPDEFGSPAEDVDAEQIRAELIALNERMQSFERTMTSGFGRIATSLPADPKVLPEQLQRLDDHLVALRNTESVNQRLFNSLHQELKNYRDNFLRESLQKPFIRDLVVLYDDLAALASQMENASGASEKRKGATAQWADNLQNSLHALVEVLHRMEVNEIEPKEMVDLALHRVVTYEPADFQEDDGRIVMRVKRGFMWRDQVLRPEEVVAKRFG
jgi:molecular chaperone GrpE (heat shock protein)